jgi:hypothetical protein
MNSIREFLFVITNFNFLLIFKMGSESEVEKSEEKEEAKDSRGNTPETTSTQKKLKTIKGECSWELLQQLGPFTAQSNCSMFLDDNCTFMAHLNQRSTCIKYYLFDWQYRCKAVHQPITQLKDK